jgi:hypothetical protein
MMGMVLPPDSTPMILAFMRVRKGVVNAGNDKDEP